MLDYLSLKSDIENIDRLIAESRNNFIVSEDQLNDLKQYAIKSASGDKRALKQFVKLLSDFNGFNTKEYLNLLTTKGNLVTRQKDLLYQSSNAILADELAILLKFIIQQLADKYNINFGDIDELSNPGYWKYEFNRHKGDVK